MIKLKDNIKEIVESGEFYFYHDDYSENIHAYIKHTMHFLYTIEKAKNIFKPGTIEFGTKKIIGIDKDGDQYVVPWRFVILKGLLEEKI